MDSIDEERDHTSDQLIDMVYIPSFQIPGDVLGVGHRGL
jgi:hypothetical protein